MADDPTKLRWKYTDEQKREALRVYAEDGLAKAAQATGIPKSTIRDWAKAAGVRTGGSAKTREATKAAAERAAQLREGLKLDCRTRAVDLIERMDELTIAFVGKDGRREEIPRATADACKDLAVAAGVLIDKAELLDGRATSRNEHRNIDAMDREIESLLSELAGDDHGEPAHT